MMLHRAMKIPAPFGAFETVRVDSRGVLIIVTQLKEFFCHLIWRFILGSGLKSNTNKNYVMLGFFVSLFSYET